LRLRRLAAFGALFALRRLFALFDTRSDLPHRLVRTLNPLPLLAGLLAR
jgi:hypothetical protein